MGYVVISYDVSDDGKRHKVASTLEDYGKRVQYSVFECTLDEKGLDELLERLKSLVESEDSIRAYRICRSCLRRVIVLGRSDLAEQPGFFVV